MPLPDPIREVLAVFRPLFTGTLLAHGRRAVAAALRAGSNGMAANWSSFHQVLNRARWSPLAVSRQLLLLIVETFVPAGACVDLVIDETLERRWGSKISKRGHYRDSALSSRERSVSSPGLRWIVMAVVVTVPWTKQRWALPFLCVLATTPEVSAQLGKRHKTVAMWAHQMISLVRRWLPDRPIKLMGDTAYSVLELGLHANTQQVTLVTTGRLDAVLHEPPPQRTRHTIGRPRVVGQRLPSLEQVLQDPETVWQKLILDWYGEGERAVELCTGTALWYRYGSDPLPIRWVLTHDPSGKRPPKSHLFHRPHSVSRADRQRLHEALESGSDFRGKSCPLGLRDATPMVGSSHRALDSSALWPLQPRGTLWAGTVSRWLRSCRSSGLVSQADRHFP
jgi:DDE superfamily endonuclease